MLANIKKKLPFIAVVFPLVCMLALFLCMPVIGMVLSSFQTDTEGAWTLSNYHEIFTNAFFYQAFYNSALIGLFSSILGLILAIVLCNCLLKLSEKWQEKITVVTNLVANFAGVPLAFAFIILLGNSGILKLAFPHVMTFNLYSWRGLVLTYLYFQIPLGVIFIYPAMRKMKKEWIEVSDLFGASRSFYWRKVGIPLLMPTLGSTFIILFANGLGTYETAYALVGSNINLLTTRISALIAGDVYARPNVGSALAVVFFGMMVLAMILSQLLVRRVRRTSL